MPKFKELLKIGSLPVIFASLCCLSPIVLVVLGLATTSVAASLADVWYYQYKWFFRIGGLLLLILSYYLYLRQKGICTINQYKKEKNKIINTLLILIITGTIAYIIFTYFLLDIVGKWLNIW